MSNSHGGYRAPSNPAPVSGPGAQSQRTDGGPGHPKTFALPDAKYGEGAAFAQAQAGAPLSSPTAAPSGSPPPVQMPTPIHQDGDPSIPVTAGVDMGAGPGSDVLGLQSSTNEAADLRQRYGDLIPLLVRMASNPRASKDTKASVAALLAKIG